ncbi:MAG: membrane protein insertase YidC [Bdellovibrionia bacterium]
MEKNTILAVALSFLIMLGWQKFYVEPQQMKGAPLAVTSPGSAAPSAPQNTTQQTSPQLQAQPVTLQADRPETSLELQTQISSAQISDGNLYFKNWVLKNYRQGLTPESAPVDLESVTLQKGEVNLAFDDPDFAYLSQVRGKLSSTAQGALWVYEDSNVKLTREFQWSQNQPAVQLNVRADFKTKRPKYAFVSLYSQGVDKDPEAQDRQLVYWSNQSLERLLLKDSLTLKDIPSAVQYIAATSRYFILSLIPQPQAPLPTGLIQPVAANKAGLSLVYPITENFIQMPLKVYFGPKELDLLRQVEPTLDHTVDFGWFTVFAYPLLKILKWLYQFAQNYGLAIIVLTLLLKIATYPLTYKSMKSMKKMAKLQPQLQKIRERYKDDKEALNREMLVMMKNNGYNPMAGCLPMLIQMPIFFALYRVLYSSIELYHAPFMFWIQDLSSHDPFYVTPILLSATMFIQQKLTPNTATDPAQAKMMQLMPLIFGALMMSLPAGLTVYMLVNALASIVQQIILNKKFDAAPA